MTVTKEDCKDTVSLINESIKDVHSYVESAHGRLSFWRNSLGVGLIIVTVNCALAAFGLYMYINSVSSYAMEKTFKNEKSVSVIDSNIRHIKEKVDEQGRVQRVILEELRNK